MMPTMTTATSAHEPPTAPASRSATSPSASAPSPPSTTCPSPSSPAGSPASSAPTAPARRPRCGCCSAWSAPAGGTATIGGQRYDDIDAAADGGRLRPGGHELPPRPHRPRPPARPRRHRRRQRRRASTRCSSWSASRPRRASGPAATPWACASGSGSPRPCWATRRCSCWTSRPTAWTPRASGGCAVPAPPQPQGKTILVSSHMLSEVEQTVDDVVIIANGRFVRQGVDGVACTARRPRRRHERRHRAGRRPAAPPAWA